jgi:hypothetical protein
VGAASRRPSPLGLPLVWGALHALAYSLLGVNAYFWYYGPALLALLVAAALGAQFLADMLRPRRAPWAGVALAAALAAAVVAGEVVALGRVTATRDVRLPLYREIGLWLRANTPPDARIGMLEVGVIGYYAERPVVDFAGLIQPEVADQFAAGGRFDQAAQWAVERYRPDYIVNQESALPLVSADAELTRRCAAIAFFHDPRAPTPVTVYRCGWGGP